jgi:hypothetical protein
MVKNPPAKDRQGRPKNKVERKKSIVQQAKEKARKKSKSKTTKGSKKPPHAPIAMKTAMAFNHANTCNQHKRYLNQ